MTQWLVDSSHLIPLHLGGDGAIPPPSLCTCIRKTLSTLWVGAGGGGEGGGPGEPEEPLFFFLSEILGYPPSYSNSAFYN